jgi:CHAT domain-containing protein
MNDGLPRHPEARVMAAFVDGILAPNEVAAVAEHLRGCSDCRTVVAETARFEREEESSSRPRRSAWWLAAAAIFAAVVIAVPLMRPRTPIAKLIAASPREHRLVEARLSGFPWARMAAQARGTATPDPADLKLAGVAGDVLETKDAHATGVAYLLIQRRAEALAALARAAKDSNDPKVWNDLAAARYVTALRDERPSQLPEALADADHALRIAPTFAEGLFNRALVIEAMGLREQARNAWQKYLDVDGGSAWAVEAREHLRKLSATSRRFDPKLLATTTAVELVREFPQEARTSGEGPLLAEWADATIAGNEPLARSRLAQAREIGEALVKRNGDHLLLDAVEAIEHANDTVRRNLTDAHVLYRTGGIAYSRNRTSEAEKSLRLAAAMFTRDGSPMAGVAAYFAACAAVFENRVEEARASLESLLDRVDAARYPSLAAEIRWELAVAGNVAGDWGTAVRQADASTKIFLALGERAKAAQVEVVAAHALDLIGDNEVAWQRRLHALSSLDSDDQRDRRTAILHGSAGVLHAVGRDDAAGAVLALITDEGGGNATLLTLAHTDRARIAAGDSVVANRELAAARADAMRIADPTVRQRTEAQIALAAAVVRSANDPRGAAAEADRALAYFEEKKMGALLPDAHLQLARASRKARDERAAVAQYRLALDEVEKQQATINEPGLRAAFLDTAGHIVDEAVDLHLSLGEIPAAFSIADHARGSAGQPSATPPGAATIEYAVLPHSVAIFCLTNGSIVARNIAIEHGDLDELVASFADEIRRNAPEEEIRRAGGALHRLLLAPVVGQLAGVSNLLLIPDRQLHAVPFAALYDAASGRYVVQEFTIRFARNAMAQSDETAGPLLPALVVADPETSEPRLLASREEAAQIAAMYNGALIAGGEATRARFIAAAPEASLIHYSGHANSDATTSFGALLLTSGLLSSADIARLPLARHPLVLLAACGTFRGDPMHVAGMSSIARAFLRAGARGVVGTLWEVDDDLAAALFGRLHQFLRTGAPPARALREAQLAMLNSSDPRLRQPAAWAPVELLSGS